MEKRGIAFKMKTAVESLADIDADVILMATGRRPNVEGLNLEAAGLGSPAVNGLPVDEASTTTGFRKTAFEHGQTICTERQTGRILGDGGINAHVFEVIVRIVNADQIQKRLGGCDIQ